MRAAIDAVSRQATSLAFGASADRLDETVDALEEATRFMLSAGPSRRRCWPAPPPICACSAWRAAAPRSPGWRSRPPAESSAAGAVVVGRFFAEQLCPAARGLAQAIVHGAGALEGAASVWAAP